MGGEKIENNVLATLARIEAKVDKLLENVDHSDGEDVILEFVSSTRRHIVYEEEVPTSVLKLPAYENYINERMLPNGQVLTEAETVHEIIRDIRRLNKELYS